MAPHVAREHFAQMYQGKPPWEIGKPQGAFVAAANDVKGAVLDAGCGTGENALYFAGRGHPVTGVDYLEGPLALAQEKNQQRGLSAEFLQMDALALDELPRQFDTVTDCGLFHTLSDADRARYVRALTAVLRPGGLLCLFCFSEKEPGDQGPRRVTQAEIAASFADGWSIESMIEARWEVRPDLEEIRFSPGGPHGWFCRIRREAPKEGGG